VATTATTHPFHRELDPFEFAAALERLGAAGGLTDDQIGWIFAEARASR